MRNAQANELAGESQSVGWISSTDSLLLFVAMLTMVAMVYAQQWSAAETEVERISQMNTVQNERNGELAGDLDQLRNELKRLQDLIREGGSSYATAIAEIDRLKGEIAKLNEVLQATKSELGKTMVDLDSLQQQLKSSEESLLLAKAESKRLSKEIERLKPFEALKEKVAELEKELGMAVTERNLLRAEIIEALNDLMIARDESAKLRKQLDTVKNELALALQNRPAAEIAKLKDALAAQTSVKRELLGLKGDFKRVAILFDASGSMNIDGLWDNTRKVVESWLNLLDMKEFVLIVFNSGEPKVFPSDGTFATYAGGEGVTYKADLGKFLSAVTPVNGTFTRGALERAYRIDGLDTIVLFTDGAPNDGNSGVFDPREAALIYEMIGKHKDIPINTVGLGDYFKETGGNFLKRVAEITRGNYLGR